MCPGHVPGSRSDKVSERSTTLAPASDAKSKAPPLPGTHRTSAATQGGSRTALRSKPVEISFGVEAQASRIADYLGLDVLERLVDQVLRDVQVLEVQRVRDADEARLFGRDAPVAANGCLQRLLVASEDHRHLRPLDKGARDDVGVHGLVFDLVRKAPCCQVGEADPERVTVRLFADVADDYVFDGERLRLLDAEDAEASDHVRVHSRPRVVLSQSIDVEDVYVRDRQSRHHLHVLGEELGLALVDLCRGYRLDDGRLVVGVLDGCHAEEDVSRLEHLVPYLDHEVADTLDAVTVQRERLLVLSEPDGSHLHEAALYSGAEIRVGFDPVDEHHTVGLGGDPVHVHGYPPLRLPKLHDLHRGAYRRPTELFCDAKRLQDLDLPLCRRPAVASHRRHDKRLRPHLLQDRDETAQDPVYLRDASAPRRERYAHTWPDSRNYLFPAQLLSQLRFDALDSRPGKFLPDLDNLRELHL